MDFEAPLQSAGGQLILRLPEAVSKQLPSRGQVAMRGTLNGAALETVVEPDGLFGHWIRIEPKLQEAADLRPGDAARVELEVAPEWPEVQVPEDLLAALADATDEVRSLWRAITPMARWEWVRWLGATKNPKTRERRVAVSISKLSDAKRRPCCFNLSSCTDPSVSKSGKLVVD